MTDYVVAKHRQGELLILGGDGNLYWFDVDEGRAENSRFDVKSFIKLYGSRTYIDRIAETYYDDPKELK